MRFIVGIPHSGETLVKEEYERASAKIDFCKKPTLLEECVRFYKNDIEEELLIGKLLRSRSNVTVEIAPHFMLITKLLREVFPQAKITALRKSPWAYRQRRLFPGIAPQADLSNDDTFFSLENALYSFMLAQTPDVEIRMMP